MKHYTFDIRTRDGCMHQFTYLAHDEKDALAQAKDDVPEGIQFICVGRP